METKTILIIDDEDLIRKILDAKIRSLGHNTILAENGEKGIEILKENKNIDLVFCDIFMPKISGFDVLNFIQKNRPDTFVIIMTAYANIDTAVKAMSNGAFDYLIKPFTMEEIPYKLNRVFTYQNLLKFQKFKIGETELKEEIDLSEIIGVSQYIINLKNRIKNIILKKPNKILISGPIGTGKKFISKIIAQNILKKEINPLIILPEAYPESEISEILLGINKEIEKDSNNLIIIENTERLTPNLQEKFAEMIQNAQLNKIYAFTTTKASQFDNLKDFLTQKFIDLFNENIIFTQPLSSHKEDIPLYLDIFIKKYNEKYKKNIRDVSKDSLYFLLHYQWPDNLLEMENCIESAIFNCDSDLITPEFLHKKIIEQKDIEVIILNDFLSYKDALRIAKDEIDKHFITLALNATNNNKIKAAKVLNISVRQLYYRMKALGIN